MGLTGSVRGVSVRAGGPVEDLSVRGGPLDTDQEMARGAPPSFPPPAAAAAIPLRNLAGPRLGRTPLTLSPRPERTRQVRRGVVCTLHPPRAHGAAPGTQFRLPSAYPAPTQRPPTRRSVGMTARATPVSPEALSRLFLVPRQDVKSRVHPWIRLNRVIRDIPSQARRRSNPPLISLPPSPEPSPRGPRSRAEFNPRPRPSAVHLRRRGHPQHAGGRPGRHAARSPRTRPSRSLCLWRSIPFQRLRG